MGKHLVRQYSASMELWWASNNMGCSKPLEWHNQRQTTLYDTGRFSVDAVLELINISYVLRGLSEVEELVGGEKYILRLLSQRLLSAVDELEQKESEECSRKAKDLF